MVYVKSDVKNHISRYDFVKISDFHKNPHSWAENFQISKSSIFFKIRNFGFVEEYLWESDNLLIKRKKRIQNHHLNVH